MYQVIKYIGAKTVSNGDYASKKEALAVAAQMAAQAEIPAWKGREGYYFTSGGVNNPLRAVIVYLDGVELHTLAQVN